MEASNYNSVAYESGIVGNSANYFKGLGKKVIGAVTVAGIAGIVAVGVLSSGGSNSPNTGTNPVVVETPTPYSTIDNLITPTPLPTNTPTPIQGTPIPDYVLHPLYEGVVEKMDTATPEDVRAWVTKALDEVYYVKSSEDGDRFLAIIGQAEKLIELSAEVVKINNFEFEYYWKFKEPCYSRKNTNLTKEETNNRKLIAKKTSDILANDPDDTEAVNRIANSIKNSCLGLPPVDK
jgi:sulfur relay (sulfurtransferase) DsrC/TusE family protein